MYYWYFLVFLFAALCASTVETSDPVAPTLQIESAPSTVSPADCCGEPPPGGRG